LGLEGEKGREREKLEAWACLLGAFKFRPIPNICWEASSFKIKSNKKELSILAEKALDKTKT
jgi:hypothetical protein